MSDKKNDSDAAVLSRRMVMGTLLAAGGLALPAKRAYAGAATNNVIYASSYGVVADGVSNDAPALQNAVAAMSNGCVLVLPAGIMALGSWGWTGILVSGLSNIRIEGNATGIKWLAAPSQATGPVGVTGLRLYNCTKATISDISINGNSTACIGLGLDTCTSCVVSGVEAYAHAGPGQFASCKGTGNSWRHCSAHDSISGSACRGFLLGNPNSGWQETDQLVLGCSAQNNDATGFGIEGVRVLCIGNLSENNQGAGFASATANGSPSTDHSFIGNVGRANLFHGYQLDVYGPNVQRVTLIGNDFSDNVHSGIYCANGTDITITGNLLSGNGSTTAVSALVLYASDGVLVSGNMIEGDSTYGICISTAYPANVMADVAISNNRCVGVSGKTVLLEAVDGSSSLQRFTVTGNLIQGGSYGLYVRSDAYDSVIDSIVISNNIVQGASTSSYYFNDFAYGQSTNLRLTGNAGGNAAFGSNVVPVVNASNAWNPRFGYQSAAPTAGTWAQGDIFYNPAPAAGGYIGWVCTSGGTPGVWNPFGSIGI